MDKAYKIVLLVDGSPKVWFGAANDAHQAKLKAIVSIPTGDVKVQSIHFMGLK